MVSTNASSIMSAQYQAMQVEINSLKAVAAVAAVAAAAVAAAAVAAAATTSVVKPPGTRRKTNKTITTLLLLLPIRTSKDQFAGTCTTIIVTPVVSILQ